MGQFSIDADHQKRRRQMQRSLALVAALAAAAAQAADAYASYVKLIPNGGNVPDSPNIGHLSADGTTGLNDFGEAYEKAGNAWTTALCQEDTDGDGYTNGQELGDPCCTWTTSNTAGLVTSGISHPSDASKTPTNAELTAGCSSTTTAGSSNSTTGGDDINDVLAPVSAGSSSAMPQDDDEDDSDEMAETSNAPHAAVSAALALVAALAATVTL